MSEESANEFNGSTSSSAAAAAAAAALKNPSDECAPQVGKSNYIPAQVERHLEFLDFNSEGDLLMGCSNLTGRYWNGSLWYYKEPETAPSVQGAIAGVDCDYGIVDGFFLPSSAAAGDDSKPTLIALDNGSVERVNLVFSQEQEGLPSFYIMERISAIQEHDDIITGMTKTPDRVITCSYDKSIVVLDLNTMGLVSRFDAAHSDLISGVSANPLDPNVVASAGYDGVVATWDLRNKSLISGEIYENTSDWPTAVEWSPQDDNIMLIGCQSGAIAIYDVRNGNKPVAVDKSIDKQIHRFKFSPFAPDTFAVSADTFPVRIFEISKLQFKIIYEDEQHEDFVRGLAWHPKTEKLWTCGWDHKVLSHEIIFT